MDGFETRNHGGFYLFLFNLTSNIVLSVFNTEAGMLGLSGGLDISITPYLTSYNDVKNTV